jgi:signal transduction histidine kinase/DNA-binding response OmpR family regulator/ligand-binding sensor domain-containing protein
VLVSFSKLSIVKKGFDMGARFKFLVFIFLGVLTVSKVDGAKFYSINAMHGISLREVNSVCTDRYGFVWASSKSGILRLTEDDYRIYHLPYGNTNVLEVKLIYESNQLIAFTNNGQVFLFNSKNDHFDLVLNLATKLDTKHLSIHSFLIDESGVYWIATTHGFYKYDHGHLKLFYKISEKNYKVAWYDKLNFVLVDNKGIWLIDRNSSVSKCICTFTGPDLYKVSSIYLDPEINKLWFGTVDRGLFVYDFARNMYTPVLEGLFPQQPILAIEKNSDKTYLLGIDGQGIWEINRLGDRVLNVYRDQVDDPSSLKGNGVYDIFCDSNRRVWVCTYSGGLSFFDQSTPMVLQISHHVNNANSLINNDVNGIVEDRSGKIWFATNNGLSCWDKNANKWQHFLNDDLKQANVFLSVCEDDKGRIWAGSYTSGVYVLDENSGRLLAHYANGENGVPSFSNLVLDVYKDSQGDIWIGGINGGEFICYLVNENKFRNYTTEPISVFTEFTPGKILLGCSYGLLMCDKQTGQTIRLLMDIAVRSILVVNNDIWIGTGGDGIVKYNYIDKSVKKFTTQSGLSSNYVNSIIDVDGFIYLGTENGLCRFNPQNNSFVSYASIYALSQTSFNKGACFRLHNGQLAWGTNNGSLIFAPLALKEASSGGQIFFQDLSVSGRSVRDSAMFNLTTPVDSLESLNLRYFQNTFSLELLPLKTNAGAKFSWKLEGFDKEWSLPSDNRILTYTNLSAGDYVLKIRLYDSSLSNVVAERKLELTVIPPFWKTFWFWGIAYAILIGLAILVLKYYLEGLKQKHAEEKVRFFTNTAHDIRTSLTLIKAPVEELSHETNLSDAGRQYLNMAIEQARRLSTVVTQLMDFQKVDIGKEQLSLTMIDIVGLVKKRIGMFDSLAKNKEIDLHFAGNTDSYFTAVDEQKMEKVVDNLLSNAIKYSHRNSNVFVDFKGDVNQWVLSVKDHGIGMSKEVQRRLFKEFFRGDNAINSKVVGSGIGLLLVKNYVQMHRGEITCSGQENKGCTFQIIIPTERQLIDEPKSLPVDMEVFDNQMIDEIAVDKSFLNESVEIEMKVLIVEDNDDLLLFMKSTLSKEFKVFIARNGVEAWAIIGKQMPDLVVSDIMMPEMDGFELCKKVKSTFETSHVPIVLLTALSEKTEQLKGLGLGADDYLTKPFDVGLLVERIKSIVRNRNVVRNRALRMIKSDGASEPILSNELNDKFMKRLLEVAEANIANAEFSRDDFASAMNVSPSLLYKKVKSLSNLSPSDFIKIVRLDHAQELLQTRKYTVTEVSELCGFTSAGYFGTVFRRHFGKLPTEILES